MKRIKNHFKKVDNVLYKELEKVIAVEGWENLKVEPNMGGLFVSLCWSIINQQLSKKAAETIFSRFKLLFEKQKIEPQPLSQLGREDLRRTGISYSKIKYLQDLSDRVLSREVELEKLGEKEDEKIIEELIKVKGIGKWTAEMFLLFALGRKDVFSYGDLILRKRVEELYFKDNKREPNQTEVEAIVLRWKPYRSYASRILWRSNRIK